MEKKMQSFKKFSHGINEEKVKFTNWVLPSDKDLALEYKIEYQIIKDGQHKEKLWSENFAAGYEWLMTNYERINYDK